jgi:hypothetical protein
MAIYPKVTVESYLFELLFCGSIAHLDPPMEAKTPMNPSKRGREIVQDANCTRDLAALAERKNADANADGPDGCQQPHGRETRTQKDRR